MSFNTFGKIFRFTTWGESHGPAIGCVVDGCPPNIKLSEKDIMIDMNRRRPGKSKFTSQRKESDKVQILSGVFKGKTTGTPISMIIYNEDAKSRDYETIKDKFRPGHADLAGVHKYDFDDIRNILERSSARETTMRVALGSVCRKLLEDVGIACNKNAIPYDPHPPKITSGIRFGTAAATSRGFNNNDFNNWKKRSQFRFSSMLHRKSLKSISFNKNCCLKACR